MASLANGAVQSQVRLKLVEDRLCVQQFERTAPAVCYCDAWSLAALMIDTCAFPLSAMESEHGGAIRQHLQRPCDSTDICQRENGAGSMQYSTVVQRGEKSSSKMWTPVEHKTPHSSIHHRWTRREQCILASAVVLQVAPGSRQWSPPKECQHGCCWGIRRAHTPKGRLGRRRDCGQR